MAKEAEAEREQRGGRWIPPPDLLDFLKEVIL